METGTLKNNRLKKLASALGIAFYLASSLGGMVDTAYAARTTEPWGCKQNGRIYNPQTSSIIVDAKTGNILSGDHIDERRYPASMTKMMTALLIFDALHEGKLLLSDEITVKLSADLKKTHHNSKGTWLDEGTKITVEEALLAIAVASANNVSVLMAENLAGSEKDFVSAMNKKAQALGMSKTIFKNASGLPDKGNFSTARDMAKLAFHLYHKYPEYYLYFSQKKAEFGPWRGKKAKRNHNELAVKNKNIDGIKTGFICDSGYNLAASATAGTTATKDKERVIVIVFGGRTPYQRNMKTKSLIEKGLQALLAQKDKEKAESTADMANINDDRKMKTARKEKTPDEKALSTPDPIHTPKKIQG